MTVAAPAAALPVRLSAAVAGVTSVAAVASAGSAPVRRQAIGLPSVTRSMIEQVIRQMDLELGWLDELGKILTP